MKREKTIITIARIGLALWKKKKIKDSLDTIHNLDIEEYNKSG